MTVSSEINRSGPYVGNGVTTVFDYDFKILHGSHLRVVMTAPDGAESVVTAYGVSGVGNSNGGSITMIEPPLVGYSLTIFLNVPFVQETDLENQGAYYAETVEQAFDLSTMRDLQLKEMADRAVMARPGVTPLSIMEDVPEGSLLVIGPDATITGSDIDVATVAAVPGLAAAASAARVASETARDVSISARNASIASASSSASSAASSQATSQQSLQHSVTAGVYASIARASSESAGSVRFFDSHSMATAALGSLPNGQAVEIYVDETRANARTRYTVEAGLLVFKLVVTLNGSLNLAIFGASPAASRASNTAALQAGLDTARDLGISWYLPPGDYQTGPLIAYTSGLADGRLVIDNNPAYDYGLLVSPLDEDVEDLDLAFLNTLAIERGGNKLAALAPYYGYSICITNYGDEVPIIRTGGGTIRWIEPFVVSRPDGTVFPPFANTKTVATWVSSAIAKAIKIRNRVVLDGVDILIEDGAGGMVAAHVTRRPNVTYRNCDVNSESVNEVLQGFTAEHGGNVVAYEKCRVNGLTVNQTNYGWNFSACSISLIDCEEMYCRRGQDAHGGKAITIVGGSFPDGIGGHWVNGLWAGSGVYLASQPNNTAPILAAGGDVRVDDAEIRLNPDQFSVMAMRGDLSEWRGAMSLQNSRITIDCSASLSTDRYLLALNFAPAADGHNWGRTIFMPDLIQLKGNNIHQVGASFTGQLYAANVMGGNIADDNPGGISAGGLIDISGNSWRLDSPLTTGDGNQKLMFGLPKNANAWNAGEGYKIKIEDLPCLRVFSFCAATAAISTQRSDWYIDRVGTLQWGANFGAFREARLGARTYTHKIGGGRPSSGSPNTAPVGDEIEIKTSDLFFQKSWNPTSIADGAYGQITFTGCFGVTAEDFIVAKHRNMDEPGWITTAECTTDGEIIVTAFNRTGSAIDEFTAIVDIFVRRT